MPYMSLIEPSQTLESPWSHRAAMLLLGVVFPVIWMGGLVTTYDAGMAVPDWPGTYGYNLLLYPISTWLAGPWNLFVEHGHRLLASAAGIVAIGLVVVSRTTKASQVTRMLAIAALIGVCLQGALGGARVLLDARQVALIHGCVGPAYFAFCACVVLATSRTWQNLNLKVDSKNSSLSRSAATGLILAYTQLVLGAHLRHPADDASPRMFHVTLLFHIVVGIALAGHIVGMTFPFHRKAADQSLLTRSALALVGLLIVQLGLGFATLISKYGWPDWLGGTIFNPAFTVTAKGFWSSMIVTAHVANGSLILATLAVMTTLSWRLYGFTHGSPRNVGQKLMGVIA